MTEQEIQGQETLFSDNLETDGCRTPLKIMDIDHLIMRTDDIVNGELWRLFPVINVDKVEDIPCDYPGAMGVPITALDRIGRNDGSSGLVIIDSVKPRLENGRECYMRFIIRNLKPELPEKIDLAEYLRRTGSQLVAKTVYPNPEGDTKREALGTRLDNGLEKRDSMAVTKYHFREE